MTIIKRIILLFLLVAPHIPELVQAQEQLNTPRIAFVSNRDGNENIFLMLPDGTEQVRLTSDEARDWNPAWSPDGSQILFSTNRDGYNALYVMNFDGSNQRRFFNDEGFNDVDGAWSSDGSRIAFVSDRAGFGRELFIADANGSNIVQITKEERLMGDPVWSPDGSEIVFWRVTIDGDIALYRYNLAEEDEQLITPLKTFNGAPVWVGNTIYFDSDRDSIGDRREDPNFVERWGIYSMRPNGDLPTRLSEDASNNGRVTVSSDGKQLAFVSDRDRLSSDEIYVMNVDGSFPKRLTENGYSDHSPAWQPKIPDNVDLPPTPTPAPDAVIENTEEEDGDVEIGPAVGLSVNGVNAIPITQGELLLQYGIKEWHDAGWKGEGIKVGVIDTAFGDLDTFEQNFIPVILPAGESAATYASNNPHGTHVLEVIHTIAPEAELYACRYAGELENLKTCTEWMLRNDVFIINHSVGIPLIDPDGQNEWALHINEVFDNGAFWVNSSGNFQQSYVVDRYEENPERQNYHNFVLGNGEPRPLIVRVEPGETYSGTVLLSWNSNERLDPVNGQVQQVDLDLEITSRARDDVPPFGVGNRPQRESFEIPQYEIVYLDEVTETFQIDVKNAGLPFERQMEFSLVVEFAPVEDAWRAPNGSVVAPSDATSSLTVGSVNRVPEITTYSSRGAVGLSNFKPDVYAPGEIYLRDGTPFIGTSAAAPVISGMAALILQADEEVSPDTLPARFKNDLSVPLANAPSSIGLVRLNAPPGFDNGVNVIDIEPFTVFPQPDDNFIDQGFSCSNLLDSRLDIDVPGYVSYNLGLAIRSGPGEEYTELVRLDLGEPFTVIDGPECTGSSIWWKVELDNGADGWVSEGFDYYLIAPKSLERAQLTKEYDAICENAVDSFLQIGDRAIQTVGNRFFFRGEGGNSLYDNLVNSGATVYILGGPTCEGERDNELRWYIRILAGDELIGAEGWLTEGGTQSRNLVPASN